MRTQISFYGNTGDDIRADLGIAGSAWISGKADDSEMRATFFVSPRQARQIIDTLSSFVESAPGPTAEEVAAHHAVTGD